MNERRIHIPEKKLCNCNSNIMVSICCITYNHEKYIADAIEGFLMQETTFPFEIIIGEDCSSDRTREIAIQYKNKYPILIKIITSEINVGATKNFSRTIMAAQGKYIAICEGDDYWTDPQKLQKQVLFLESNHDYAMVHSDASCLIQTTKVYYQSNNKERLKRKIPSGYIYEQLLINNSLITLTVVMRKTILQNAMNELALQNKQWKMTDYPLWLEIAKHHNIHYIDESLGVYRVLPHSASHNKDMNQTFLFDRDTFDVKFYFLRKYGSTSTTLAIIKKEYNEKTSRYAFELNDKAILEDYPLFKDIKISFKVRIYQAGLKNSILRYFIIRCLKIFNYLKMIHPSRIIQQRIWITSKS